MKINLIATLLALLILNNCSYEKQIIESEPPSFDNRVAMQVIPLPNKITAILTSDEIFIPNTNKLQNNAEITLNKLLQLINNHTQTKHLDIRAYNDNVSTNYTTMQANTIAAYLWKHGIPSEKISTHGLGSKMPVSNNKSASGRADNRRIEITLLDQLNPPLG